MKRLLSSYLLSIGLVLTLSACGNDAPLPQPPTEPTFPPPETPPPPPPETPPPPPTGSSIDGTVTAPSGGDVGGTVVVACGSEECDPDVDGISTGAPVKHTGPSAPYAMAVAAGQYMVVAIKDANSSGELDAGDYVGFYSTDGQNPTPVSPPATGINIQMIEYSSISGGSNSRYLEEFSGELPHFPTPK